jgi:hypothetical protein
MTELYLWKRPDEEDVAVTFSNNVIKIHTTSGPNTDPNNRTRPRSPIIDELGASESFQDGFHRMRNLYLPSSKLGTLEQQTRPDENSPEYFTYWPRIHDSNGKSSFFEAYSSGLRQIEILFEDLSEIFHTVEPKSSNLVAFGHRIRNLLILACTEVEAQWRGVLSENGYQKFKSINGNPVPVDEKYWNTQDYVKLLTKMKLNEFSLTFEQYPGIPELKPFSDWNASSSTGNLVWYKAYNSVKHNREEKFQEATLENAINAVAAVIILFIAQYNEQKPLPRVALKSQPNLQYKYVDILSKEDSRPPNRVSCQF